MTSLLGSYGEERGDFIQLPFVCAANVFSDQGDSPGAMERMLPCDVSVGMMLVYDTLT